MLRRVRMREIIEATSAAIVLARAEAVGVPGFPGEMPTDLDEAYVIQRRATMEWPDAVAGWKIGRIPADAGLAEDRFVGPIFSRSISTANSSGTTPFHVFAGGFAAVEAELVVTLARTIAPEKTNWTPLEASDQIAAVHIGIEVAGSPDAAIPHESALASIAAFGNNAGLILGATVPDGLEVAVRSDCSTTIDGVAVGQGIAADLPGGPATALAFALSRLAHLGIEASAGSMFATGAITGVHPIRLGQSALADFGRLGSIAIETVSARPLQFH